MTRTARALLLLRTARHLRVGQVAHRVRLRGQQTMVRAAPQAASWLLTPRNRQAVGWPQSFTPLDARTPEVWPEVDQLASGQIRLLGRVGPVNAWRSRDFPLLWRMHLHYWDWAWSLAEATDRVRAQSIFSQFFILWRESTRFGHMDEWSSYVVSLRAWSWCGQYQQLVKGTPIDEEFLRLLRLHEGYLRAHMERDVGGNHLLKNLKALIGLSVFFDNDALLRRALKALERELSHQVLPDGGHYERSPAYHCQVLADLIDIATLLSCERLSWLEETIARMRKWLGLVMLPDGAVPLLNDGFPVPPDLMHHLGPGDPAAPGLTLLPESGLAVGRIGDWSLVADVGDPCPDELPAHAHADALSFLLYHKQNRVVGEAFTSTYAPGVRRAFERSTAAHTTVQIDGVDSTEVWGAFRAARRARVAIESIDGHGDHVALTAAHDGYRRLKGAPVHRRRFELVEQGLQVTDEVQGVGKHFIESRVYLEGSSASFCGGPEWTQTAVEVATGWEKLELRDVWVLRVAADLPWTSQFMLRPADG